jgi:hypothetical protein
MALTLVLNPEKPMIDMVSRNFSDSMRAAIDANEDYLTLEKDYPGISNAMVEAMTKAMLADLVADIPADRRRYARFYASQFTPAETAELIAFYSSSAGQRLIAAKYATLDAKPLMKDFAENPESEVSQQQIRDINRAATNSIIEGMSPADKAALLAFAKTPVFAKLTAARGEMEKLEAEIANEPDPELDKALDEAADSVFVKFTGKKRPAA